jgi:DnaA family protein
VAPARLQLRPDLLTRLGWGLVFQVHVLSDDDKRVALKRHAAARAFDLRDEIVEYLLRHLKRDLPSLMAVLDALDRYSLETKRPITLPLLRQLLQSESGENGNSPR